MNVKTCIQIEKEIKQVCERIKSVYGLRKNTFPSSHQHNTDIFLTFVNKTNDTRVS